MSHLAGRFPWTTVDPLQSLAIVPAAMAKESKLVRARNQGETSVLSTPHRIVDFHNIYTVPLTFLESLLMQRLQPRLRLLPPYREHLSQAFARYFMRVGLPVAVVKTW